MIKVIPKYYTVKVVIAKACDIVVDEVFSSDNDVYRVVSAEEDNYDGYPIIVFEVMNLETGAVTEMGFAPNEKLPVHVKIQRV